ncbi:hypothetical protein [Burkholderia territorii]|uniref:hypothetical protein n=1 Tax=Burkholderia territorii TaxID=1503055 RepID=UPI00075A49BD|nr:hypothetical protein [Burkholderia territorii]KUZ35244.1 hypothetical protein WS52_04590 [Burkholderia territorii]KUZ46411.1 hypothetical protein WS53_27255 [Burkholderia territorii]
MKERPILFSGPMVRAILEGRKMQTRRLAIPKRSCIDFIGGGPKDGPDWNDPACWGFEDANTGLWWALHGNDQCRQLPCPHGGPGDRLWVRETCRADELDSGLDGVRYPADGAFRAIEDSSEAAGRWLELYAYRGQSGATVPAIHMPRWASRITLEITGVRAERLQSIGWDDAIAEGIPDPRRAARRVDPVEGTVAQFRQLWDGLNAARGYGWDVDPWVWVVEFRRIES